MLKFAILRRVKIKTKEENEEFEVVETEKDGLLEYDQEEFVTAVMIEFNQTVKKGSISGKCKVEDIELALPKAFEKVINNIKQKTIYVKGR